MDLLKYNASLIWNLVPFGSIMFDKGQPIFWHTIGMQPMPFHTISMTIIFMVLGRFIPYLLPILPHY